MTKTTALAVIALLGCLTLTIQLQAQGGDLASKIKQLQEESKNAQMKNDVSWMKAHLADGYIAGNSWGAWQSKAEVLKDMENNADKFKSGEVSEIHVATYGDNVAVSRYTFTYDAELEGKHRARTVLGSDTWVNDSGAWKTAASHCSLVKGM